MANESKFVRNADGSVSFEINDKTILSAKGKQAGLSEVTADDINSGTSTQGQILTSGGDGTASWMNNVIPNSTTDSTQYSLLVGNNGNYSEIVPGTASKLTTLLGNQSGQLIVKEPIYDGYLKLLRNSTFITMSIVDHLPTVRFMSSNNARYADIGYWNGTYSFGRSVDGILIRSATSSSFDSPQTTSGYYFPRIEDINQKILTVATVPTSETFTIASADWLADATISPFTYKTTMTATTTIGQDTLVELLNDNAVNFATYGFSIGDVTSQVITIYSIGQPSSSVTFTVRIGN